MFVSRDELGLNLTKGSSAVDDWILNLILLFTGVPEAQIVIAMSSTTLYEDEPRLKILHFIKWFTS